MTIGEFADSIVSQLPYEPTEQQLATIGALARFCRADAASDSVFMLCGYAGTGKTTLVAALVKALFAIDINTVLLAPTGRAAKVFANYSHFPATTIHRKIYYPPAQGKPFEAVMDNPHQHTFFIVDEASMIGMDSPADLLSDLIHYVYSGHDCRMILVGDTAQLPPIGCDNSPALNPDTLRDFGLRVSRVQLTHTVRQANTSGILYNATELRKQMRLQPIPKPQLNYDLPDVYTASGEELPELLSSLYATNGIDETIIVTRTNWRATQFNIAIRNQILDRTELLSAADLLLVVKNNYHWASKQREMDFIANGDTARVTRIYGIEDRYGFRFADVALEFPYREVSLDCKILLECLTSDSPALTQARQQELFEAVYNDPELFSDITPRGYRLRTMRTNPYYQALQVKYAYAITCHKAQGGQWANVVVDLGGIKPESLTTLDFHRWLYTATTRATQTLHYLNPL